MRHSLAFFILVNFLIMKPTISFGEVPEGYYAIQNGYYSESLELKAGKFIYSKWVDVGGSRPKIEGSYRVEQDTVVLDNSQMRWTFRHVCGVDALWAEKILDRDPWESWKSGGKFSSYGDCLFYLGGAQNANIKDKSFILKKMNSYLMQFSLGQKRCEQK
jgi:hypothetical protein